ncbi:hypothetical protein QEH42_gp133 [Microbacterium phage Pumpernickel]|nr:hypothetical protein QEH42_gp133 [Microbacterium phage Pumpernickel]UDL16085.1 hypothetical protein SEA_PUMPERNICKEL_335 [Microbacterium phage Pumpernickel]
MAKKNEPTVGFRIREELRRGSRTSPHEDSRTKRARTRRNAKRKAIRDFD